MTKKVGLVEAADGGTLSLDEIREMNLVLQAKLLTLMDTLSFRRVGAVKPIRVDVRFVATTNKILLSESEAADSACHPYGSFVPTAIWASRP